jgi:hypothetical protein
MGDNIKTGLKEVGYEYENGFSRHGGANVKAVMSHRIP